VATSGDASDTVPTPSAAPLTNAPAIGCAMAIVGSRGPVTVRLAWLLFPAASVTMT
jgi:hypothetical protein